jgi:hypothetical protein
MVDMSPPPDTAPPRMDTAAADAPPPSSGCTGVAEWMSGVAYKEGDLVTHGTMKHKYQCRPWPNSGWCPIDAYEPGKINGFWPDAWNDLGACP